MLRERHKQRTCKADNTDVPSRGGLARSSDEAVVMIVEQRGSVILSCACVNWIARMSV